MEIPGSAVTWVVGVLVSGALGGFGLLARRALGQLEESITGMATKLDGITNNLHAQDTASALLQAEVARLSTETQLNRERYHSLAQEVTILRGRCEMALSNRSASGHYPAVRMPGGED